MIKKARFFRPDKQKGEVMENSNKTMTNFESRIVTTKKGTYLMWYDAAVGRQRRVNLSKTTPNRYFGTGCGRQR